jgi:hypothetical protein
MYAIFSNIFVPIAPREYKAVGENIEQMTTITILIV